MVRGMTVGDIWRGHDVGDLLGSMLDIMLGTMLGSPGMSLAALSTSLRMLTGRILGFLVHI